MRGVTFTDYDTVTYLDFTKKFGYENSCQKQTDKYFDMIEKYIFESDNNIYLIFNEKSNKFIFYRNDKKKYDFVPTKKQMEEFINNEDTVFNNRVRKCLKLSDDKRRFYRIQNSGTFEGVDDALFFIKYIESREDLGDLRIKGARNYIVENATEDFDKYINFFNNRIEELSKKRDNIKKEADKEIKTGINALIISIIAFLFITAVSLMFCPPLILLNIMTVIFIISGVGTIKIDTQYRNENTTSYNEEIKELENMIEKLKEKESEKINSVQEKPSHKKHIEEFKGELLGIFFNNKYNLLNDANNAEYMRVAMLLNEYDLEMNMFYDKTDLSLETEKSIDDKYMQRALSLKKEILSRSYSQTTYEMNLDELQEFLSSNSQNGISRALRQRTK